MRRLPPSKIEQNLAGLLNLTPASTDELLQRIDQPLTLSSGTSRKYVLSDYNRDGDSYRSPWTNKYDPPIDDGFLPSSSLRALEVTFNDVFDAYRELYYEGGVSSVYLWDLDEEDPTSGWAGCFLIQKDVKGDKHVSNGSWNSIHVVECNTSDGGKKASYKLTTTIMVTMNTDGVELGATNLAGSMTRQSEIKDAVVQHGEAPAPPASPRTTKVVFSLLSWRWALCQSHALRRAQLEATRAALCTCAPWSGSHACRRCESSCRSRS